MKIIHVKGQEQPKEKKKTKKDLEREYAVKWVLEQKAKNAKKVRIHFAKEVEEIRKFDPDFSI